MKIKRILMSVSGPFFVSLWVLTDAFKRNFDVLLNFMQIITLKISIILKYPKPPLSVWSPPKDY